MKEGTTITKLETYANATTDITASLENTTADLLLFNTLILDLRKAREGDALFRFIARPSFSIALEILELCDPMYSTHVIDTNRMQR